MKFSTRARYGLRLMLYLAVHSKGSPVLLKEIAKREDISEKYLGQIIIPFKARGLVATKRGAQGGYLLGRDPSEILIREIIETQDGELALVECLGQGGGCSRTTECITRELWNEMNVMISGFLEGYTLRDLADKYEQKISGSAVNDYTI